MPFETQTNQERLRAILMQRVADRRGLRSSCPIRACRRNPYCHTAQQPQPSCLRLASPEDRSRFDELLATIETIRTGTLWPEPAHNAGLRAIEANAIDILQAALPLMPDFAPKFEHWLSRYNRLAEMPFDIKSWLAMARAEIDRCQELIGPEKA